MVVDVGVPRPTADAGLVPADTGIDAGPASQPDVDAGSVSAPDAGSMVTPDAGPLNVPDAGPVVLRPATKADFIEGTFKDGSYELKYRLFVPQDYRPTQAYGLIIFLHGAGERGTDNNAQVGTGPLEMAQPRPQRVRQAFIFAPQCPPNAQWVDTPWAKGSYKLDDVPMSAALKATLNALPSLQAQYSIDATRIAVTGLSMGGFGAWDAAMRFPSLFSAVMPICGAAGPTKAGLLSNMPLYAFHGGDDDVVPVTGSRDMVNALKAAGSAKVNYTEYPGVGHNSWNQAYSDAEALRMFFSQHR